MLLGTSYVFTDKRVTLVEVCGPYLRCRNRSHVHKKYTYMHGRTCQILGAL